MQVRLNALREYLVSMRESGYTIVGLEQTMRSKCSSSYKFQHQTVLVLGWVRFCLAPTNPSNWAIEHASAHKQPFCCYCCYWFDLVCTEMSVRVFLLNWFTWWMIASKSPSLVLCGPLMCMLVLLSSSGNIPDSTWLCHSPANSWQASGHFLWFLVLMASSFLQLSNIYCFNTTLQPCSRLFVVFLLCILL